MRPSGRRAMVRSGIGRRVELSARHGMGRHRSLRWWPPDALRIPFAVLHQLVRGGFLPEGCQVDGLDLSDETFGSIRISWPDEGIVDRPAVEEAMTSWWHGGRPTRLALVLPFRRIAP